MSAETAFAIIHLKEEKLRFMQRLLVFLLLGSLVRVNSDDQADGFNKKLGDNKMSGVAFLNDSFITIFKYFPRLTLC